VFICRRSSRYQLLEIPQPILARSDTVIYPSSIIEVNVQEGGERGRLLVFAQTVISSDFGDRIMFFVDADFDRLLERPIPSNVIFTNGRDLESYLLMDENLDALLTNAYIANKSEVDKFKEFLSKFCRPVGILRTICVAAGHSLPFQRCFLEDGGRRFLAKSSSGVMDLKLKQMIQSLLNFAGFGLTGLDAIVDLYKAEYKKWNIQPSCQILHGKDLINTIVWDFCSGSNVASHRRMVEASIFAVIAAQKERVLGKANIAAVMSWIGTEGNARG
jgi:hypothetical protein